MTLLRFLLCLGVAYSLSLSEESNTHSKESKSLWYQGSQLLDGIQSLLAMPGGRNLQQSCNLDSNNSFQIKIILDFYGNPHLLSQEEEELIGETIKLVYNEQVVTCTGNNCREIADARKMPTTFVDQGNRDFSLSYTVSGNCQGCYSNMTLFKYIDRKESDTCPCQGPSLQAFIVFFRNEFKKLVGEGKLTSVTDVKLVSEIADTPKCPAYSTLTSSDVVLQFYGCLSKLSESDFQSIATLFVETYNLINGINAKMCDRFFRRIESAKAIPQSKDNFQCPGYFEIRLDITAQCRGCDVSTFSLFDKEMDSNFVGSFDNDNADDSVDDIPNDDGNPPISDDSVFYDDNVKWRYLDVVAHNLATSGTSNCQCPLDRLFRAVTDSEMANAYNLALSPLNLALECWGVVEVQQVPCTPTVKKFQTEVKITIESSGSLSQADVDNLMKDFINSYNRLTQRYCDPYFREIQDAKVSSNNLIRVKDGSLQSKAIKKKTISVTVIIGGKCRGCPPKPPIIGVSYYPYFFSY
jgi:Fe-S cluster biogenesis protein NfuA